MRVALFICYELRFPEVFAEVAAEVDAMIVIANWPAARQEHWDALLRARAIENQCFVIGVNRIGVADGLTFAGGSVVLRSVGRAPERDARGRSSPRDRCTRRARGRSASDSHSCAIAKIPEHA